MGINAITNFLSFCDFIRNLTVNIQILVKYYYSFIQNIRSRGIINVVGIVYLILGKLLRFDYPKKILSHLLLESVNFTVDLFSSFKLLFHGDEEVNTVDDHLDQLNLRETKSISVGDVVNLKLD